MPNQSIPYLCGGVFLTRLMKARPSRNGVREHYMGDHDGLSDPETMLAFIKAMSPNFTAPAGNTFKENTSSYKNCRKNCGIYLPFAADSAEVRAFDECVRNDYTKALTRMGTFTDGFLETGTETKKDEYLVQELVEIIKDDKDIPATAVFYINEDGSPSTKAQLLTATAICFQAFLVGVWHYILMNRPDNLPGRSTIQSWTPKYSGICIERVYPADAQSMAKESHEPDEPIIEIYEETGTRGDDSKARETTPPPKSQIVFQQFGNNGTQIGNVGTLIINPQKD